MEEWSKCKNMVFNAIISVAIPIVIALWTGVFLKINEIQPEAYMDEIFHIPQAKVFCGVSEGGNFTWNPKITTLPGTYLMSIGILIPLSKLISIEICNVFYLRLISFSFNILNSFVIYNILIRSHRKVEIQGVTAWWKQGQILNPAFLLVYVRRVTKKSQLMEVVLSYSEQETMHEPSIIPKEETAAYLVDLMALIRSLPGVSDTYRELTQRIVDALPTGYARVDIVADTYRKDSLKNSERIKRGHSAKVLINSAESKIPRNFSDFLKNGENKGRMIEIIKDEMDKQKHAFLEKLKCNEIMFSVDKVCIRMTEHSTDVVDELSSNQEEADTKLLLHAKHVFNAHPGKAVLIRSPSGDVDINILFLALFPEDADRIYIDYGTGKSRKVLQLSTIDMPDTLKSALVGFHAFSGNDYISSIFRKSKRICWKKIEKSKKFTEMFAQLGNQWRIDVALQGLIEEYVCSLFMKGKRDINEVRYEMFKNIYEKKSRIQDLSLLPPCRDTLNLRSKRCNYVAKVWKSSLQATIEFDVITANGWSEEGKVIWMNEAFPPDVTEILMDTEEDSDLDETLDGESDSDYDSD
ncbi:putative Dol-P-Glc:Glc(2)Man(9)GlcNAc(2)-PP-Dol alpha-1,2-glucosyltransferase [Nymphon striatum]|nr:putative Dol-P-Glc:Glc(2)Man(9)GlcNAc(2)-PP-Dol alpha-1,2-glucosyltransferase [Nymphon striatum]